MLQVHLHGNNEHLLEDLDIRVVYKEERTVGGDLFGISHLWPGNPLFLSWSWWCCSVLISHVYVKEGDTTVRMSKHFTSPLYSLEDRWRPIHPQRHKRPSFRQIDRWLKTLCWLLTLKNIILKVRTSSFSYSKETSAAISGLWSKKDPDLIKWRVFPQFQPDWTIMMWVWMGEHSDICADAAGYIWPPIYQTFGVREADQRPNQVNRELFTSKPPDYSSPVRTAQERREWRDGDLIWQAVNWGDIKSGWGSVGGVEWDFIRLGGLAHLANTYTCPIPTSYWQSTQCATRYLQKSRGMKDYKTLGSHPHLSPSECSWQFVHQRIIFEQVFWFEAAKSYQTLKQYWRRDENSCACVSLAGWWGPRWRAASSSKVSRSKFQVLGLK